MSNHMIMPVVETGPNEEAAPGTVAGTSPVPFLPEAKNYAEVEDVKRYCQDELNPLMEQVRMERMQLEDEWNAIRRMNLLQHDAGKSYHGRSNAYLPVYRRNRSTFVSQLSRGLFPSDEYFDCVDLQNGDPEAVKPLKAYMQWEMETNARVRTVMKPFLGQLCDYGTSPMKIWYAKELQSKATMQRKLQLVNGASHAQYGFGQCRIDGMRVSARNLFYWYIYPVTCDSIDDAQLIFEDIDVPRSYVEAMVRAKRWIPEVLTRITEIPLHDTNRNLLLEARGHGSDRLSQEATQKLQNFTISEAWTFMVLPASAYLPFEEVGSPVAVRVVFVDNLPVEVTRNPFFHQRPPYRAPRTDFEPGYFYGSGMGRSVRHMQYLVNDFANQTNDCGTYGLNPIAKINPSLMVGPPKPLKPGGTIFTMDVNAGIQFDRPPIEQVGFGMNIVTSFIAWTQDWSGTPPIMQGNPKGAKTATQSSILQKNAAMPIQDIVEDIELDTMIPMLEQGFSNAQQYREEGVMATVAGESVKVSPEDLAVNAKFRWLASSQAVNAQMRAQQAIQLIQAIIPLLPHLMQAGYIVDFVALIRRVYVDGFGFRGFSEFIRKAMAAPQVPGVPEAMGGGPLPAIRPDQQAGVAAEQGDRLRSALEQVYGSGVEMAPGEGDDFAEVRANADEIAGRMGGLK